MSKDKEDLKTVNSAVSNSCLKKLRQLAIEREVSLSEQVREILEKSVTTRKYSVDTVELTYQ